ncbi:MAG: heptaprenyl diphosphate synthase [Syntrophomonadaceae bacterium]|nr:heptaprenyl diphosphate synthase [Syntrophomonadaceae bacterium]
MDYQKFFKPIERELQLVEAELLNTLDTELPLLQESSRHLIKAGGKRLRPAFVLLAGRVFTDRVNELIHMAVALELVHLASLVHDDVIDSSLLRRGKDTVKAKFGNQISIYAGNYILARALMKVAEYNRADVVDIIADTSIRVCEGEIVQLQTCFDVNQTLKDYLDRIERKTALLMAVSCHLGALLIGASPPHIKALKNFGHYLGMSFQITDDILDFIADEETLGKPTGSDIRQGIITLPALYALRKEGEYSEELRKILSSSDDIERYADRAMEIVRNSGGIEFSERMAQQYVKRAHKMLRLLPVCQSSAALGQIADFVYAREF